MHYKVYPKNGFKDLFRGFPDSAPGSCAAGVERDCERLAPIPILFDAIIVICGAFFLLECLKQMCV